MKKMIRLTSVILSVVILLSAISIVVSAEGINYKNFKGFVYTDNDVKDGCVRITNYKGKKTKVTIPKKIKGKKVVQMTGFGKIKQLHIPDGIQVMYIAKAKKLKKITVNKSNKKYSVKNNLLLNKKKTILYGCPRKNTNPKIPSTVKTIEHSAFTGATFEKIKLPNNLKTIGIYAFANCKKLESIELPSKLKNIEGQAFWGCNSLKEVKIPDSVTAMGSFVFGECKNLKKVTLGKGMKYLNDTFFYSKLKEVEIPETVERINGSAFSEFDPIESVYIYNKNCKIYYNEFTEDIIFCAIPENVTIYGYEHSTAQKYAKKNGNEFVVLK